MNERSVPISDSLDVRRSWKAQVSLWLGALGLLLVLTGLAAGLYYLALILVPSNMPITQSNRMLDGLERVVNVAAVAGEVGVVAGILALAFGLLGLRDIHAGQGLLAGRGAGRWGAILGALSVAVALTLCTIVYVLFGMAHI